MGRVRIGLSGWNYPEWKGSFYPTELPRNAWLSHTSRQFDTLEVNATFYGLQRPATFERWRAQAPRDFVFAVKGSKFITHNKRLADSEGPLANFFAQGVLTLGNKLGPLLWQLPANFPYDAERIDRFLDLLPRDLEQAVQLAGQHDHRVQEAAIPAGSTRRLRHVLEPRHESWFCAAALGQLRRAGVALALSHAPGWPLYEELTAGFVYIRLHGAPRLYYSAYGEAALRRWARMIASWRGGGEPADARRVTERKAPARRGRDVYVYFDNTAGGCAPDDAHRLGTLLAAGG